MMRLRKFMFENLYSNPVAKSEEVKVHEMIKGLFGYYMEHKDDIPEVYTQITEARGESTERAVCDYIASMSDRYSVKAFEELFVPRSWSR